jgi:uncharacterized lipoprotein YddW (UPF0748 family)
MIKCLDSYRAVCCLFLFFVQINIHAQDSAVVRPEMRAVWIATVDNIDWPDKPTTNSEEQKASFIRLLDMHQRNGINTLIVQIRPATDAFYASNLEPWSEWLTGKQGLAPEPFYDPLSFMVTETHKRGMEFHAWMNPYRAVFNIRSASIATNHVTRRHPNWFLTYGDKKYFDPGHPEARQYVVEVVKDVVKRYNVDAIHFDDYFYPYPIPGKAFPDYKTFKKYGNGMARNDWRRSNVDSIITMLSNAIRTENKNCQFGISPFGVWRNDDVDPRGSKTKAGPTNYDFLYADILLWLKNGWIDYVAPQIYWEIGHKSADYEELVNWWSRNTFGKNCYIGIGLYKAGSNYAWKQASQLPRQIDIIRKTPNIQGMAFFSSRSLEKNLMGWADTLRTNYFKVPAPTPKVGLEKL